MRGVHPALAAFSSLPLAERLFVRARLFSAPLEAMAAELPVVAPDSGGILSYADDTTAWLAKPTGAAFAAAVRQVIDQPVRAAMRARVALDRAATFHADLVVPRFFSLLDSLHAQRLQDQAATTAGFIAGTLAGETATSR